MKKIFTLSFALMLCLGVNAQVMKIYKGSTLVKTFNSTEADRVVFEPAIPVQSIVLSQTTATVNQGTTLKLTATVLPEDATIPTLAWSSSDPQVATVNDGVVTGIKAGEAIITCEAQDGSGTNATCTITVEDKGMNLCVGFYETIPGYSVKDLTITYNGGEYSAADNVFLFEQSKVWNFGKLSNFASAQGHESGDAFIARSATNATRTDFMVVSSETKFGDLSLVASYTLTSVDGSGEIIKVEGAHVMVPGNMVEYKSGFNCYLLFKIIDRTTEYFEDPKPKDMYPMAYELIYQEIAGDGGQSTR